MKHRSMQILFAVLMFSSLVFHQNPAFSAPATSAACSDPCGDFSWSCGSDLVNTLVGLGTIRGAGGRNECLLDIGVNLPFIAADINELLNETDPEVRHQILVRLTFDTMCDLLDCIPAGDRFPNIMALRGTCACGRLVLGAATCYEAVSVCKIQQGTLPLPDPTRPDGECGKSTVMNSCETPLTLIEEQCRALANTTNYPEPALTNCYRNCMTNTVTLQSQNCEKIAKGTDPSRPSGRGTTVKEPLMPQLTSPTTK